MDRTAPAPDWPEAPIAVGRVLGAWGVRGWIKVAPDSDQPDALVRARRWWLESPPGRPAQRRVLDLRLARTHSQTVIALPEGLDGRDQAEALKGWTVLLRREDFPPAEEGSWYWVDLIGCRVVNREGLDLGAVTGLLDSGAQSILQVRDDGVDPARERLIPFVDAFVLDVDVAARRIGVDWQPDYD